MSASARVIAPEIPLYQLGGKLCGARPRRMLYRDRRPSAVTRGPKIPIYQLGAWNLGALDAGAQVVAATAPIASVATTGVLEAVMGVGTSVAGPIGAAAGAIVGLIAGFMAGHELRAKQAKNENAAVNLGVPGFDQGLRQLQQAYKAGQISAADVQQGVGVLLQNFWQEVAQQIQPGRNGCNSGASCPPDTSAQGKQPCTGNIGAACCVGCYPLTESVEGPSGVLAALAGQSSSSKGQYIAEVMAVGASKYGTTYRAPYTLDLTPPATASGSLASAITGGSSAGSSSSMLPLLLIAGLAYLALK